MRLPFVSIAILPFLFAASPHAGNKLKTSQRIGDLVVTFLGLEERESEDINHHVVAIRLMAENMGKHALCVSFTPNLQATFDLKYSVYSGSGLQIKEMLPGEKTEGEYGFLVKNGVRPLRIVLRPFSETQTCGGGSDSFSSALHYREQVELDLSGPPAQVPVEETTPEVRPSEATPQEPQAGIQTARVFLTGRNGNPPDAGALKAFRNRCPQVLTTTRKAEAKYVVELVPASFKHGNTVVVVNQAGDIIHSGTPFTLGNAAKDACAAILRDLKAVPK